MQKVNGDDLVGMVIELINDADDDKLVAVSKILFGCDVTPTEDDDEFLIHWEDPETGD